MTELVAGPIVEVLMEAFSASGDMNQSDGRGGRRGLGIFTEFDEAYQAARGAGVQGGWGEVMLVTWVRYESGLIGKTSKRIFGRRERRSGPIGWEDGFLDYRDLKGHELRHKKFP